MKVHDVFLLDTVNCVIKPQAPGAPRQRLCRRGLDPAYGSHTSTEEDRKNRWALVASDAQNKELKAPVQMLGLVEHVVILGELVHLK